MHFRNRYVKDVRKRSISTVALNRNNNRKILLRCRHHRFHLSHSPHLLDDDDIVVALFSKSLLLMLLSVFNVNCTSYAAAISSD